MKSGLQHYINHISLVVDRSGSMGVHSANVIKVFDTELTRLKQRSIDMNQETRISIYLFDSVVECLAFDMDVMRFNSLKDHYYVRGQTALLDGVLVSLEDHKALPTKYGDHAFLTYVLTDGEENHSAPGSGAKLLKILKDLPEEWTTAILVPDARGVHSAKGVGFSPESIAVWDVSGSNAVEKAGKQFSSAIDSYMVSRSQGVRGTKAFFASLDTTKVDKKKLEKLKASTYDIYPVRSDGPIKEFVESFTDDSYRLGSAYYMPTKKVTIQDHKHILVQETKTGNVYEGSNLRDLLGLPKSTATVEPGSHKDWRIFVQSTSTNRKLFKDTFLLVMK